MAEYFEQSSLWARPLTATEQERLRLVADIWPSDVRSVLEVGCGSGTLLNGILWGPECVGLDPSPTALRHVSWPVVQGSAIRLPFSDRQFDAVVIADVMEHLPSWVLDAAVGEIKRVSRRLLLVISPFREPLASQKTLCRVCECEFHPNGHLRSFDRPGLETLFGTEFKVREFAYFGDPWRRPHPVSAAVRRGLGSDPTSIDEAICPQCGTRQGDLEPIDSSTADAELTEAWLDQYLADEDTGIIESEILLWFERKRDLQGADATPRLQIVEAGSRQPAAVEIRVDDVGVLDFDAPTTSIVPNALRRPVMVVNSTTAWGDKVTDPDGGICRLFCATRGSDGHALFAMPSAWVRRRERLRIGLRDQVTEGCFVQVYLAGVGYSTLGRIGGSNDGEWHEFEFDIRGLAPLDGGRTLFRLLSAHPQPGQVPIGKIALLPASRPSARQAVSAADASTGIPVPDDWLEPDLVCTIRGQGEPIRVFGSEGRRGTGRAFLGTGPRVAVPDWYIVGLRQPTAGENKSEPPQLGRLLSEIRVAQGLRAIWPEASSRARGLLPRIDRLLEDGDATPRPSDPLPTEEAFFGSDDRLPGRFTALIARYHRAAESLGTSYAGLHSLNAALVTKYQTLYTNYEALAGDLEEIRSTLVFRVVNKIKRILRLQ